MTEADNKIKNTYQNFKETDMVNEFEIKKQICDIGKRIYNQGMVAANDGNISVKLNDHEFLCTPTGVSKGDRKSVV